MPHYAFHPAAAEDYLDATRYYLQHASKIVAFAFNRNRSKHSVSVKITNNLASNRSTECSPTLAEEVPLFFVLHLEFGC